MREEALVIDGHVHFFPRVAGKNITGRVAGAKLGKVATSKGLQPVFPLLLEETRFPLEMLVELLDQHGVAKAVLLQNPLVGFMNEEVSKAVKKYPDRFVGTLQVDPRDSRAEQTIRRFTTKKHSIVKFELSQEYGWSGIYPGFKIDEGSMDGIWQTISDLHLQVIIDPGPIGGPGYQLDGLERITADLGQTTFLLEHLGYLQKKDASDPTSLASRQRYVSLAKRKNVYLGLSAAASLIDDEYPCHATLRLLQEAVELVGADKIIWGTDAPITLKFYTYRQMIDMVAKHATFLSDAEIKLILGENARRAFPALAS